MCNLYSLWKEWVSLISGAPLARLEQRKQRTSAKEAQGTITYIDKKGFVDLTHAQKVEHVVHAHVGEET